MLDAALPGLPQLDVPPQRLLQLQHRGVLHHHHGCRSGGRRAPVSAPAAGLPPPAGPGPGPPRPRDARMVSPSALQTRTVMACPYSSATCEPISSAVTYGADRRD